MSTRPLRTLRRVVLGASLAAALLLGQPTTGEARGGAQPAAPKLTPNQRYGAQLFDQCIWYVSQGTRGITRTNDFHISVDAELDLDTTRHRGPMRLWWRAPDKYRQELTTNNRRTTKILNGEFMWIVHPTGSVQRMHGTAEGAQAIRQLKADRLRMGDLAQFITLQSLKSPGATFEYMGEKVGKGSYAGKWLKLTRRAPGATTMHFWLAYDRAQNGGFIAKWPGVVRIDGDAARGIPTEDFILKQWANSPAGQPHKFRYPKTITAYSQTGRQRPVRFLQATVQDIRINTGTPDSYFKPPAPRRR
ncbi:MAG: hypothetical protein QNJ90_15620 [Planctomycetota bacterium]|nr:hypothetical protein [Planctomycetota bacterium]